MKSRFALSVATAVVSLLLATAPALADWNPDDGHKMHFPQLPEVNGFDINFKTPLILADDWLCSETGPVQDIHFWFSAQGDWFDISQPLPGQIFNIHVSIHANIPAGTPGGPPYSTPGALLWERDFGPTDPEVIIRRWGTGIQSWYDEATGQVIVNDHQIIYQCNIAKIPEPFYQKRGEIYWLDVSIDSEAPLGWKTADRSLYPPPYAGIHFEDDAVWRSGAAGWQELVYPEGPFAGESLDLAFVITGKSMDWDHKMHFPQKPDPRGADVYFNSPDVVAADDWQCSETGRVADIHFWFSALNDWIDPSEPLNQQIFRVHVSIHEDIPDPDGPGPEYSQPGVLLWERTYSSDEVVITRCYTPGQAWLDPIENAYLPDNHRIMYRCDITNIQDPFRQEFGKIYWLDVWMEAGGPLGWKTADVERYPPPFSGKHFQDDAVWGQLPAPIWQELVWPAASPDSGASIDLAFVITRDPATGADDAVPESSELGQNIPNPFNPSTVIHYRLAASSEVVIAVYTVQGQLVRVLESGFKAAGPHEVTWDGRDLTGAPAASGVYFYQLKAGSFTETKKMVLTK